MSGVYVLDSNGNTVQTIKFADEQLFATNGFFTYDFSLKDSLWQTARLVIIVPFENQSPAQMTRMIVLEK